MRFLFSPSKSKHMTRKCLYCYKEIDLNEAPLSSQEYHERCSKAFFGTKKPPRIEFGQDQLLDLAERIVRSHRTITGVQPKLSLGRAKMSDGSGKDRLTIVGLWGEYILKPQSASFSNLPEIEDLTMHLAQASKIETVPHTLIRLESGQLAYITKRVDRRRSQKLHMEDMCQLTERLTEYKYKGSYEQIAKAIKKYVQYPGLDVVNFFEVVMFSFLTGNNDMHLKNFSLLKNEHLKYNLCPAYDLVASELVVPEDDEELALNLNGKKKRIRRVDFVQAMSRSEMNAKAIDNVFQKFEKIKLNWNKQIDRSFLDQKMKTAYSELIDAKFAQLEIK